MTKLSSPSVWRDDELVAILDDANTWLVVGKPGMVLCFTLSLRAAVERALKFAWSGATVTSISRQPSDNVVILLPQLRRLGNFVATQNLPASDRGEALRSCHPVGRRL